MKYNFDTSGVPYLSNEVEIRTRLMEMNSTPLTPHPNPHKHKLTGHDYDYTHAI